MGFFQIRTDSSTSLAPNSSLKRPIKRALKWNGKHLILIHMFCFMQFIVYIFYLYSFLSRYLYNKVFVAHGSIFLLTVSLQKKKKILLV